MTIPIVFAFDESYALPASIAVKSLMDSKSADTEYKVYVLYDNLGNYTRDVFEKICPISWIRVPDGYFENLPQSRLWPKTVYYRMLIPDLIPEYDRIIWSDVDVLFRGDLSEAFTADLSESDWAGVAAEINAPDAICHPYHAENKNGYIFWSGFIVFNAKRWRENRLFDKCLQTARIFSDSLEYFDLEVLNIVSSNVKRLPLEYCVLETVADGADVSKAPEYGWLSKTYSDEELRKARSCARIVHYAGINPKVWNRRREDIPDYYWEYIVQSPFYRKGYYNPGLADYVVNAILLVCYKMMPVATWRERVKKRFRAYMYRNQYKKAEKRCWKDS